jgi:hypothetical protein
VRSGVQFGCTEASGGVVQRFASFDRCPLRPQFFTQRGGTGICGRVQTCCLLSSRSRSPKFPFGELILLERFDGFVIRESNVRGDAAQTIRKQDVTIYAAAAGEDKAWVINGCLCCAHVSVSLQAV